MNKKRETFRLEARDLTDVYVEIKKGATTVTANANSLSLSGIFVEPNGVLTLKSGDVVDLTIEFEGKTVHHRAIVRRKEGRGFGLSFGELSNTKDAHGEMRKIVMELQRRWLAKHKHVSD